MNYDQTTGTKPSMLFSPAPHRRRLQLRLSERRLLLMAGDALAVLLAVFVALRIWSLVADEPFTAEFILPQAWWFFALTGLWFVIASANDFYDLSRVASRGAAMQKLLMITMQLLVVYVFVFFFSDRDALPRLFIIYYGVASFLFVTLWRMINPALVGWASEPRRALVIGTDWAAETIITTLAGEASETYELLGVIGEEEQVGQAVRGVPIIGTSAELLSYVQRNGIRELILTSTRELSGEMFQSVMDAYEQGVAITPMPLLYERVTERVPVEHVGSHWAVVLPIGGSSELSPYRLLKRVSDVVLSLLGLVLFAPFFPLVAVVIWLDSRGPIFFTQTRVGLNGRHFRIIKFRTMIPDAEKYTGAVFADQNDPRITRFGRFMRRVRLDEIPQLINVLRGDMSLIGPRPERPEHIDRLQQKIPFYRTRHTVRPGVTGWAQVRYKYGNNDEDALIKLQYDLYYIRHQSPLLDLNILIRTIGKVLSFGGQ